MSGPAAHLLDPYGAQGPWGGSDRRVRTQRLRLLAVLMLCALACLGGLVVLGDRVAVPSVERHLEADVRSEIAARYPGVEVRADGLRVVLSGTVSSETGRARLIRLVGGRWGVGEVDGAALRVAATSPSR